MASCRRPIAGTGVDLRAQSESSRDCLEQCESANPASGRGLREAWLAYQFAWWAPPGAPGVNGAGPLPAGNGSHVVPGAAARAWIRPNPPPISGVRPMPRVGSPKFPNCSGLLGAWNRPPVELAPMRDSDLFPLGGRTHLSSTVAWRAAVASA